MPPEQFGGRAVPASDLYSLGATLIALITKQHPADLPQQDLQIEFEQFTQLSPGFTSWLKWMTHPSLERRPASVQIAKEVLEKPEQINKYSLPLKLGKNVKTFSLFKNAILNSTWTGTIAVGTWVVIYNVFLFLLVGTFIIDYKIIGRVYSFAFLLGLGNGIIIAFVTRLCFFPLTNPKLHRQLLAAISILVSTSTSMVFFFQQVTVMNFQNYASNYILLLLAPSLIAGLSMGAVSKCFAEWYQRESKL